MPGNIESIPKDTEMIPGVHRKVILTVQLLMKPQRKDKVQIFYKNQCGC